jgi:hypothetical protein
MFSVHVVSLLESLKARFRHQTAEVYNCLSRITIFNSGNIIRRQSQGGVFDGNLVFPVKSVDTTVGSRLASRGHTRKTNDLDNAGGRSVEAKLTGALSSNVGTGILAG